MPPAALAARGDAGDISPLLGSLKDNGGATQTMLPLPGSPAIDAGGGCVPCDGSTWHGGASAHVTLALLKCKAIGSALIVAIIRARWLLCRSASRSSSASPTCSGCPSKAAWSRSRRLPSAQVRSPRSTWQTLAQSYASAGVTANGTGGTYSVTAHTSGVATPVTFTLTNLVPLITITTSPNLLVANGISTSLVTVRLMSDGQPVIGYTMTVSALGGRLSDGERPSPLRRTRADTSRRPTRFRIRRERGLSPRL